MKKIIIVLLLITFNSSFSQTKKDDLLVKVAEKTCECIDGNLDGKSVNELQLFFGLCIMKSYNPFKEEFKKIDATYNYESYEELGEEVGIKLIEICPDNFSQIFENEDFIESIYDDNEKPNTLSGKFLSISGEEFNYINIKDENGKKQRFLWLKNFEGSERFINKPKSIKKIKVYYQNSECYIPKMKAYFMIKEVTKIEFL